MIGKEIDDKYIENVKAQVVNQDAIDRMQKDITIIYTPLHGTGNIPARRVMKELGFENVYVVPEQELPDGNFPTVSYPNPEAEEAFAPVSYTHLLPRPSVSSIPTRTTS